MMMHEDEYEANSGMIDRGNGSMCRKPTSVLIWPAHIPNYMNQA
jgi:hypothetical protein